MTLKPARFLDPKTDIVFKKIFGNNPDLIKSFLNGIMPLPEDGLIEEIQYLTPEQSPRIPEMKNTIVDVKCVDQKGRTFIVEMQLFATDSFKKRLLYGVTRAFSQQLKRGHGYDELCPVYGLGIVDAVFEHDTQEWFHHYDITNRSDRNKNIDLFHLVFLELPKFKPQTILEKKMGILWLRFLREIGDEMTEVPSDFAAVPEISKAMEIAQESSFTPAELEAYDRYWDAVSTEKMVKTDMFGAGIAEGITKGIAEGIKLTAKNFLSQGVDISVISLATGLTKEEIEKL